MKLKNKKEIAMSENKDEIKLIYKALVEYQDGPWRQIFEIMCKYKPLPTNVFEQLDQCTKANVTFQASGNTINKTVISTLGGEVLGKLRQKKRAS